MSGFSPTVFATSVALTALASFSAGFMMAPGPVRTGDSNPIIDPEAWNRPAVAILQAPIEAATRDQDGPPAVATSKAGEPETKLVAWQEPEAEVDRFPAEDASLVTLTGSYSIEPLEGAADGAKGDSTIMVMTKADADRVWDSWPDESGDQTAATTDLAY